MPKIMDQSKRSEILEIMKDIRAVSDVITSDASVLRKYLSQQENRDFWLRTSLRHYFAEIEATLFQFRRVVIMLHELGLCELPPEELILLRDEAYEIQEGRVVRKAARISTVNGFLFSFRMMAKAFDCELEVDTSNNHWKNFKDVLKIRDRITHPKVSSQLHISESEAELIEDVIEWVEQRGGAAVDALNELIGSVQVVSVSEDKPESAPQIELTDDELDGELNYELER